MKGTGKGTLRLTTWFAMLLAAAVAVVAAAVALRFDFTWEVPLGKTARLSERTRNILSETQGSIRITCFMNQKGDSFLSISRLLRSFKSFAKTTAGADISIEYVDANWDLARASRLVSSGVPLETLLFEKHRRRVIIPVSEVKPGDDERICAAAIARLSMPAGEMRLLWLTGHGEADWKDYDEHCGFSDISRDIYRAGFEIAPLSLPGLREIPVDCAAVIAAAPKKPFASEELELIAAFLRKGGRMLFMLSDESETGLESIIADWGIRTTRFVGVSPKTLDGKSVVAAPVSDHIAVRDLRTSSVVFESPRCLETIDGAVNGAERPKVSMLLGTGDDGWGESAPDVFPRVFDAASDLKGPVYFAATSEQGGNLNRELAFRPTRICVVGEANFAMNGALEFRRNSNRDFILNAVAWLTGVETSVASSQGGGLNFNADLDKDEFRTLAVFCAGILPGIVIVIVFVSWLVKKGR